MEVSRSVTFESLKRVWKTNGQHRFRPVARLDSRKSRMNECGQSTIASKLHPACGYIRNTLRRYLTIGEANLRRLMQFDSWVVSSVPIPSRLRWLHRAQPIAKQKKELYPRENWTRLRLLETAFGRGQDARKDNINPPIAKLQANAIGPAQPGPKAGTGA
jgi:hypothetical protein